MIVPNKVRSPILLGQNDTAPVMNMGVPCIPRPTGISKTIAPVMNLSGSLGRQYQCRWINMGGNAWQYVCWWGGNTPGGGGAPLLGTSANCCVMINMGQGYGWRYVCSPMFCGGGGTGAYGGGLKGTAMQLPYCEDVTWFEAAKQWISDNTGLSLAAAAALVYFFFIRK